MTRQAMAPVVAGLRSGTVRRPPNLALAFLLSTAAATLSCGAERSSQSKPVQTVQQLCPQLTADVDPLLLSYSADATANARLRSFVAATRGLDDASKKMESLLLEACSKMVGDMGLSPRQTAEPATIEKTCEPVVAELEALHQAGVTFRLAMSPPQCTADQGRRAQCEAGCPPSDSACTLGCAAGGDIYASCTLPAIAIEPTVSSGRAARVAAALRAHLPQLLYAETALGRRLLGHVQTLAKVGAQLPPVVQKAGVYGMTCLVASAALSAEAGSRIQAVLEGSVAVTRRLVL